MPGELQRQGMPCLCPKGIPYYLYGMSLYRFRVYWEEDDLTYRDIEVSSGQTLMDFHLAILKAWEFDGKHTASFFESNDRWDQGRAFASDVLVNKKDAPALSMQKAPLAALIHTPNQKFVYIYDPAKRWTFLVELIGVTKDENPRKTYPLLVRREGVGPAQYGYKGPGAEKMNETEEAYDLDADEMAEGYGSEGEGESESTGESDEFGGGSEDF
jgi:hypothetical protein